VKPSAVILSPHLDDAVLSCWHLLESPADVLVVNVFAGVPPAGSATGWWDRASGNGDSASVVRARIEEDRRALAHAGRTALYLDFLDDQYRDGPADARAIAAALLASLPDGALLYAPAAFTRMTVDPMDPAGNRTHPDHLAVRAAAELLESGGRAVAWYADLPHASAGAGADWPRRAPGLDGIPSEELRLAPDPFERKLAAVREYTSQLPIMERSFGALDDPELLGREVVWRRRG
jgi:LmbE family N-acetylglucosaminyl deacetylase